MYVFSDGIIVPFRFQQRHGLKFFVAFFRFSTELRKVCVRVKSHIFCEPILGVRRISLLSRWVSQNWANYRSFSAGFIGNCALEISQKNAGIIGPIEALFHRGVIIKLHALIELSELFFSALKLPRSERGRGAKSS